MKNSTEIILLIDASGSMQDLRASTIKSVNSFIDEQKSVPGDANIRVVQFNHVTRVMSEGSLNWIVPINEERYNPNGTTALADAVVTEIDTLGRKLAAMPEHERPSQVVFVIITDGLENSSVSYRLEDAKNRIKHQESKYNWKFLYLAAGEEAFNQGKSIGLSLDNIVAYNSTAGSSQAMYGAISTSVRNLRTGVVSSLSVSEEDRNKILSK